MQCHLNGIVSAPLQWAERCGRQATLGLYEIVCAVHALDEPGIDRGRKRRIVEGHGQVPPSGFAGFLPGRANVVACRLHVEVRGAFVVALVVGNEFDVQGSGYGAGR